MTTDSGGGISGWFEDQAAGFIKSHPDMIMGFVKEHPDWAFDILVSNPSLATKVAAGMLPDGMKDKAGQVGQFFSDNVDWFKAHRDKGIDLVKQLSSGNVDPQQMVQGVTNLVSGDDAMLGKLTKIFIPSFISGGVSATVQPVSDDAFAGVTDATLGMTVAPPPKTDRPAKPSTSSPAGPDTSPAAMPSGSQDSDEGISIWGKIKNFFSHPSLKGLGDIFMGIIAVIVGFFTDGLSFVESAFGNKNDGTAAAAVGQQARRNAGRVKEDWNKGNYGQAALHAGGTVIHAVGGMAQEIEAVRYLQSIDNHDANGKVWHWTKEQASGMVANLINESNLKPDLYGSAQFGEAKGQSQEAYGIMQWHKDRVSALESHGFKIHGASLQQQLDAANYEITQGGEAAGGNLLRQANTAQDAGAIFAKFIERPADNGTRTTFGNVAMGRGRDAERLLASVDSHPEVHPGVQVAGVTPHLPTPSASAVSPHPAPSLS